MKSTNPATGDIVWEGRQASALDVSQALDKAKEALRTWKKRSFEERADVCKKFAETLTKQKELVAKTISQEMGKPVWESLSEVQAMINKVDISIQAYNERCAEKIQQSTSTKLRTSFAPHGVVSVLGPFNFPGHLPNGHIVPALLAGNTILFKPSELTPKVGEITLKIWQEAALPEGVLNLLQGGKEVAKMILSHDDVAGVYFTGSVQAGQAIQRESLDFPGRIVALEMGGNNPLIWSKTVHEKAAIYLILLSAFLTSGQRCSCARRLIVIGDQNLDPLVRAANELVMGAYDSQPEPFMGPVVCEPAAVKLVKGYEELVARGGKILLPLVQSKKCFLHPAIIDMTGCQMIDQELFGPILQVVRVSSLDEAVAKANESAYGLVAGLISDDRQEYQRFYDEIKAGVINWNVPTTGASSLAPFGGIGCSGNHRPSGYLACDYTSYPIASQEQITPTLPVGLAAGVIL